MQLKGKRVLVTGAEGFIGSHLTEALLELGCDVRAFVLYNFSNSWGWLDTFSKEKLENIEIFTGDIRDFNNLKVASKNIDIVFHLAALIGIPFSYHSPASYIDTNIRGTLNVLQASKEQGAKRIIITSTSEVYGTMERSPIDETHPLKAQSPYAASKTGADKVAESFCASFGIPVVIARPFNTYGPRQSARAVIPTIITQLLSGKKDLRLGALHPKRDFVYVKDTVSGFIEIAKSDKAVGEVINIATQTETSIGDLAKRLINMINPDAQITTDKKRVRPQNSEVERLLGCNKKIKRLTNWKVSYSLDMGLLETAEWFKENLKIYKADIYNV